MVELVQGFDLSRLTSIRIGGRARYLALPESLEDLYRVTLISREKDIPLFLLGGGSNTIFGDVNGVVVSLSKIRGIKVWEEKGHIFVEALAGTPLKEITSLALRENLEGIYRLLGFPATVGGAVAMNAGAFGVEIKDFLQEITYMDWFGEVHKISARELDFSYRKSPFPKEGVVISCLFKLRRSSSPVAEDYGRIRDLRKRTQPINLPTSGSTFKNPLPKRAGELLEKVGMKGFRLGDVAFSEKHSNFLVNSGRGTIEEVRKLLEEAKRRVYEEFGIKLEEEVRLVEDSGSDGWKVL